MNVSATTTNRTINRTFISIASPGHVAFAIAMIGLGIYGLIKHDFAPTWQPVPKTFPARLALAYLCTFISIVCGICLLWQRTAAISSRVLFGFFLAWLLLIRLPYVLVSPTVDFWWATAEVSVMVAAAWVLYIWFASGSIATDEKSLRIARALYGLGLIPFGIAHFMYLKQTTVLVPSFLGSPVFWAYFTGLTFIAAGVGVLIGVCARLAAMLSTLQIGLFTLIVWVPIIAKGANAFQWHEFVASCALTAAAWVVADSYRDMPWLAIGKR